jgi:hypothetical protein
MGTSTNGAPQTGACLGRFLNARGTHARIASCKVSMEREKVPRDELLEVLLTEIGGIIGDVDFLRNEIEIRPSTGEPNWDARLKRALGFPIANALRTARETAQALYDVDWQ